MKNVFLTVIFLVMVGCSGPQGNQGSQGTPGASGPQGPNSSNCTPTPTPDAIKQAVANYDEYVLNAGGNSGHELQQGLECTLYTVPNMPAIPCLSTGSGISGCSLPSSSAGFATVQSFMYSGTINQPSQAGTSGFNMLPTELQSLYATNFQLVCTGYIVIPDYQDHEFTVSSDDGSLLYINGGLVVNNDGVHSVATVNGVWKPQNAQVFSVQISYFQGPGSVALVVSEDGSLLSSESLWH